MELPNDSLLAWRKAGLCTGGAACVEIAALPGGGAAMRDSKDPQGARLAFNDQSWSAFLAQAKAGAFDSGSSTR